MTNPKQILHHQKKGSNILIIEEDHTTHVNLYPNPSLTDIAWQPPKRAKHFSNRKNELTLLLNALHPGHTVTVCGPDGIGKSTLANEAIRQLNPARFPDGIIFHSFYNQPQIELAFENIIKAFGENPTPSLHDAVHRILANRQALLILDDAAKADNLPLIYNNKKQCGLLIISRSTADAPDTWQNISPLDQNKASELLQAWANKQTDNKTDIANISLLVEGHPLTIRLIGCYLSQYQQTASKYLTWLKKYPHLAPRRIQQRVLKQNVAQISPVAQQTLALMGYLALAPINRRLIEYVLNLANFENDVILNQLLNYGLIDKIENHYQISHALILTYVRSELSLDEKTFKRLVAYTLDLVKKLTALQPQGYQQLNQERDHLLQLQQQCLKQKAWQAVLDLVDASKDYLQSQGYWVNRHLNLKWAVQAAKNLKDKKQQANHLKKLGDDYQALDEYKTARSCYEEARSIYTQIESKTGKANCIKALGQVYEMLDDYKTAQLHYEEARLIYINLNSKVGEANCSRALGHVYKLLDDYESAQTHYKEALSIYTQIESKMGQANCLTELGDIYQLLNKYKTALIYYRDGCLMYAEIEFLMGEAICTKELGKVYKLLKEYKTACTYYEKARLIYIKARSKMGEANCLRGLGDVYSLLKKYNMAHTYYEKARLVYTQIGSQLGEAHCIYELGQLTRKQQHWKQAQSYFQQALTLYLSLNSQYDIAWTYYFLGHIAKATNKQTQAKTHYQQALTLFKTINLKKEIEMVEKALQNL